MTPTPDGRGRPRFDVDGAHRFLLGLTAFVGVPLVLVALVWKGLGAALAMGLMVVLAWLPVADAIPQRWQLEAMRRKAGPTERIVVAVFGIIGIVICVGFILSPKNVGLHDRDDARPAGAASGPAGTKSAPSSAERILDDILRKN